MSSSIKNFHKAKKKTQDWTSYILTNRTSQMQVYNVSAPYKFSNSTKIEAN